MTSAQRLRFWLIGLAVFALLLYLLRAVLLPFVAGMAIAYFLDPIADRLERLGLSRTMATTVITLFFFLALVAALVLLAPVLQDQVVEFARRVPDYVNALAARITPKIQDLLRHLDPRDVERLRSSASEYAGTVVSWALGLARQVLTGGLAVVNVLSLIFITPVVTFYLLRDWDHLVAKVDAWLPRDHAPAIRAQMAEINRTLSGFVRGQATVCLALGTMYAIGLTAIGIELGLVIGLVSGLLSFVPYLGTVSGLVVSLAVGFAQSGDWPLPAMAVAVFAVGNLIEGNVLAPKLVGDKVGLHPVWVMFALLAGGALVGFVGILLAVPVAAVIGVLARFSLARYLRSSLYSGSPTP
ncbi:MAG: AI-2E family transporter [Magnetospirillum sp.]|nr:AI-2E family transporter [Magnetospirillum sp.]